MACSGATSRRRCPGPACGGAGGRRRASGGWGLGQPRPLGLRGVVAGRAGAGGAARRGEPGPLAVERGGAAGRCGGGAASRGGAAGVARGGARHSGRACGREARGRDELDLVKGQLPFLPCAPDLAHGKKGRFAVCPRSGTRQTCHVGRVASLPCASCRAHGKRGVSFLFCSNIFPISSCL